MSEWLISEDAAALLGQMIDKRRRMRNVSQQALASKLDCCRQTLAGSLLGDPKSGGLALQLRAHDTLDGSLFAFAVALHSVARGKSVDPASLALRSSVDDAELFELVSDQWRFAARHKN